MVLRDGTIENGTPLARLKCAAASGNAQVEVLGGDVMDVCRLHKEPDPGVKACARLAAGPVGKTLTVEREAVQHLITATVKLYRVEEEAVANKSKSKGKGKKADDKPEEDAPPAE